MRLPSQSHESVLLHTPRTRLYRFCSSDTLSAVPSSDIPITVPHRKHLCGIALALSDGPRALSDSYRPSAKRAKKEKKTAMTKQDKTNDTTNRGETTMTKSNNTTMETELRELRHDAESGDAAAQHDLGYAYRYGIGVPKDEEEAEKWWRKAAEQEHALGAW